MQEGLHDWEDEDTHNLSDHADSTSMNEIDTITFLRESGFEVMKEFESGKPLIYVYPGYLGKRLSKEDKWPCLACIDNPVSLDSESHTDVNSGDIGQWLRSQGNVTVYTINRETKSIECMSSGEKNRPYFVRPEHLFYAKDEYFPKSQETL